MHLAAQRARPEDLEELEELLATLETLRADPEKRGEEIKLGLRVHEIIARASGNGFLHETLIAAAQPDALLHLDRDAVRGRAAGRGDAPRARGLPHPAQGAAAPTRRRPSCGRICARRATTSSASPSSARRSIPRWICRPIGLADRARGRSGGRPRRSAGSRGRSARARASAHDPATPSRSVRYSRSRRHGSACGRRARRTADSACCSPGSCRSGRPGPQGDDGAEGRARRRRGQPEPVHGQQRGGDPDPGAPVRAAGGLPRHRVHADSPASPSAGRTASRRTWRFFLRKGVKFHDGKELTADDVKFSFDQALAAPNVKAKVANVTEVKAVDAHTVEIKTSGPAPSLLANIAYVFIVPKADYQAARRRRRSGRSRSAPAPIGSSAGTRASASSSPPPTATGAASSRPRASSSGRSRRARPAWPSCSPAAST